MSNKKYDYQIVTSDNKWVGGGVQATQKEIESEVKEIKKRFEGQTDIEELIVFKAEKMEQYSVKL